MNSNEPLESLASRIKRYRADEAPIFQNNKYGINPESSRNLVKPTCKSKYPLYEEPYSLPKVYENIKSAKNYFYKKQIRKFSSFGESKDTDFSKMLQFSIDNLTLP